MFTNRLISFLRKSSLISTQFNVCSVKPRTLQFSNWFKTCAVLPAPSSKSTKSSEQPRWKSKTLLFSSYYRKKKKAAKALRLFVKNHSAEAYVNAAPHSIKPYLQLIRADKPIGTLLLYFPCAFSISLAAGPGELPSFYYLGLFGVGAFLMRGAGCIINDLWDKDFDNKVERTKNRPLACGAVTEKDALKYLFGHLTLSLGILMTLNSTCIVIGFASMIPVLLYPLAKRFTNFPQVVLGLTFNIGAIMGYTAVTGHFNWQILAPLYASCILWTIYYDTVYAFQDVADDEKIGVKSIARLFYKGSNEHLNELNLQTRLQSEKYKQTQVAMFLWLATSGHMAFFFMAGYSAHLNSPFFLATMIALFRLSMEVSDLQITSRDSCAKTFHSTRWHALILLCGIVSSFYVQIKPPL